MAGTNQDVEWMRTVTPEEARNAYERVMSWASKPIQLTQNTSVGIGEWIYSKPIERSVNYKREGVTSFPLSEQEEYPESPQEEYRESLTHNAKQGWQTPTTFPLCPQGDKQMSLCDYVKNLRKGAVLSHNEYTDYIIDEFETFNDKIIVRVHSADADAIKPYSITVISYEEGGFLHQGRLFFEEQGAQKAFAINTGKEWDGPDSIDDYC